MSDAMAEVIALEQEIMSALPAADRAAESDEYLGEAVRLAQDVLCNGWTETGSRLERLRSIAEVLREFPQ